jgi:hypothetical protein
MIKLTVNSLGGAVNVQDPRPVSNTGLEQPVLSVPAGGTATTEMQWAQYERIAKQLSALADLNECSYTIEGIPDVRSANQADASNNPVIDTVTPGTATSTGVTGEVITGVNLLAGQTRATLAIKGIAGTGTLTLTALTPGHIGNTYDVRVINSGTAGLATSYGMVGGRLLVTVNLGATVPTSTCAQIATSVKNAMVGLIDAVASGTTSDVISYVMAATPLTGGQGTGLSITVGGESAVISAINTTNPAAETITYNVGSVSPATKESIIYLRSNNKVATATVAHKPAVPNINLLAGTIAAATGVTGAVITGTTLLANQTRGTLAFKGKAGTGTVTLTPLLPGVSGNLYDLTIVDSGSGGLATTSSVVAGRTVISVDLGGSPTETCATVAATIAAATSNAVTGAASGTTTDVIDFLMAVTPFAGGYGSGLTVHVGGVAGAITAINTSTPTAETITFNVGAVGTAASTAVVRLTSNGHIATVDRVLT